MNLYKKYLHLIITSFNGFIIICHMYHYRLLKVILDNNDNNNINNYNNNNKYYSG